MPIYLGDNKIQELRVGERKIAAAYLGNTHVYGCPSKLIRAISFYVRNKSTQSGRGYKSGTDWTANYFQIGNKEPLMATATVNPPFSFLWTATYMFNMVQFYMGDFRWALRYKSAVFKYQPTNTPQGLIEGKMMILNNYKMPEWSAKLNNNAFGPDNTESGYRQVTSNDPGVTDFFNHVTDYLNAGGYYQTIPATRPYLVQFDIRAAMEWNLREGASLHTNLGDEDFAFICVFDNSAYWESEAYYKCVPNISGTRTDADNAVTGIYINNIKI